MTSNILHRSLKASYPVAAGGEGVYLIDSAGKRYLDGSGGAAVSCLGHGHPKVVAAIKAQLDKVAFAHSSFFTNEPAEKLATWLAERAPGDIDRVCFVAGGSEAMEAAMKFARQVQIERGQPGRYRFIARRQSYHGATLGGLSLGGHAARRAKYEPMLSPAVTHIEACYPYRLKRDDESDEAYGKRAAKALEDEILRLGPQTVAAFAAETVVGSTMGAVAPPPGYFKDIRRVCDKHGVLLILDEVMCGMGRTGTLFACEQDGVVPDMVATAKGLGGGYQPIGALLVRGEHADLIAAGSGAFEHGHTYMAHAAACAGALAIQQVIEEDGLLEKVRARAKTFRAMLQDRFGQHPHVGDVRGRGLFVGIEFVADRGGKTPFDPAKGVAGRYKSIAQKNGLIVYPAGGTIDGKAGDHVLVAPPFIISDGELEELTDLLDKTLRDTLGAIEA
ncbi:MAG: aspartate aminotransferase family protein [Pseudomonadota bacterium]|nr:aspartate aminotransferase family protein [Pseudomonadota bacterium]